MIYRQGIIRECFAVAVVNLMGIALGLNNSWISATHHYFKSDHSPIGHLTPQYISWLSSIPFLSALVGLLVWGNISEKLGRKPAAFLLGVPPTVMYTILYCSRNQTVVLIARFIGGLSNVGCIMCVSLYAKELASSQMRVTFSCLFSLSFSVGSSIAIAVAAFASYELFHMSLLSICVLYLVLLTLIPESPVFHIKNNNLDKAKASLAWLRQTTDEVQLNKEIEELTKLFINKSSIKFMDIFSNKYYLKSMLIGLFLQTCIINATGFSIFVTFSSQIFEKLLNQQDVAVENIIFTAIQTGGCLLSFFVANRCGRRTYLITTCVICSLILFVISICRIINIQVFPLFLFILVDLFQLVISTITFPVIYIYFNEIISSESSNHIFTIMMLGKNLGWFCAVKIYTFMLEHIYTEGALMAFSVSCMVVALLNYLYIPESKNKNLETMKSELHC